MPKKDAGSDDFGKGAKAKAQKQEAANAKDSAKKARDDAADDAEWASGSNSKAAAKKAEEEKSKSDRAARKAEADAQLRAEEDEVAKEKLRGAEKVAARKAQAVQERTSEMKAVSAPSLSGTGIDAALAILSIAAAGGGEGLGDEDHAAGVERDTVLAQRMLDAGKGGLVDMDDKHPEKRMKASFAR